MVSRPDITQAEMDLYMSALPAITVLKEKLVRARFQHCCSICGGLITKNELHYYFFIKDYDAMPARTFSSRQHRFCPAITLDPYEGSNVQRPAQP